MIESGQDDNRYTYTKDTDKYIITDVNETDDRIIIKKHTEDEEEQATSLAREHGIINGGKRKSKKTRKN